MSHAVDQESASRKIFIGGLSYSTDEEKLRDYFERFGPVQDAVVMKDSVTKRSRGFGFITFDASIYVDIALEQDVHIIDSRKVEAKRAVPRSEVSGSSSKDTPHVSAPVTSPKPSHSAAPVVVAPAVHAPPAVSTSHSCNSASDSNSSKYNSDDYAYHKIFVGGLHYDTRDAEFRAYFELYGRVLSAEVMFNRETHKSRGFGFIIFEHESSVDLVCEERDHIIDGKMVEVKRAVPRTKGPPGSGAPKAHPSASAAKTSSNSAAVSAKPGVSEASIGIKKHTASSNKTATNVAIASVGMRSKPPPAKNATSYAAALRAGNSTTELDIPEDPMESEYPPLLPAKHIPVNESSILESNAYGETNSNGSYQSSPCLAPSSPGHQSQQYPISSASQPQHFVSRSPGSIGSQYTSKSPGPHMQFPVRSPNSMSASPAHRDQLPPPNFAGLPPSMMLPQSVMPHGPDPQMMQQMHHHHLPLPTPPQRGYTQPQIPADFNEGFDVNRPVRALSESFVPSNYPNQAAGLGGYYGGGMMAPFNRGNVGNGYQHQPRSDSLGELSGGSHLYDHHSRGLPPQSGPQSGPGSFDNKYGFSSGNGAQFGMQSSGGQLGGLGWLPVSLSSGGVDSSQGSEMDSAGEDAIGLGLALSMDLNDIQSRAQFGSSRVVSGEGRFETQRSRGPAPSYLPGNPSAPSYNSGGRLGGWSSGSNNSFGNNGGGQHGGGEWYPEMHDLRSTAAEFKPTSSNNSSNINSTNSTMPWMSTDSGR